MFGGYCTDAGMSTHQLRVLEELWATECYPSKSRYSWLSHALGLSRGTLMAWFQKRRKKLRKRQRLQKHASGRGISSLCGLLDQAQGEEWVVVSAQPGCAGGPATKAESTPLPCAAEPSTAQLCSGATEKHRLLVATEAAETHVCTTAETGATIAVATDVPASRASLFESPAVTPSSSRAVETAAEPTSTRDTATTVTTTIAAATTEWTWESDSYNVLRVALSSPIPLSSRSMYDTCARSLYDAHERPVSGSIALRRFMGQKQRVPGTGLIMDACPERCAAALYPSRGRATTSSHRIQRTRGPVVIHTYHPERRVDAKDRSVRADGCYGSSTRDAVPASIDPHASVHARSEEQEQADAASVAAAIAALMVCARESLQ